MKIIGWKVLTTCSRDSDVKGAKELLWPVISAMASFGPRVGKNYLFTNLIKYSSSKNIRKVALPLQSMSGFCTLVWLLTEDNVFLCKLYIYFARQTVLSSGDGSSCKLLFIWATTKVLIWLVCWITIFYFFGISSSWFVELLRLT